MSLGNYKTEIKNYLKDNNVSSSTIDMFMFIYACEIEISFERGWKWENIAEDILSRIKYKKGI